MNKVILLSLLAIPACNTDKNNNDTTDSVANQVPETQGKISGFVMSETGAALDFVSVKAQGFITHTAEDGSYTLSGVQPSDNIVISYSKKGYAKNYEVASMIDWETVNSNTTLLEIDGSQTISSWDVEVVNIGDISISFEPNHFINTSTGERYNGDVLVEATYVDPYTSDIEGAPRDLSADASDDSSQLVSYGMVDVSLYGENNEKLSVNVPAKVRIPITNGNLPESFHLSEGDQQATWSFDTDLGIWVEEGVGNIVADADGNLIFDFRASHFSWWNCDQGFVPSCAEGRVIDFLGFPIRGAEVTCAGGQTTSTVTTDEEGKYTCSIMVGDSVTFTGNTYVDNRLWTKQEGAFFMDSEGSSAADCEPISDIQIDVCRIAGAINVENYDAIINPENGSDAPADGLSAVFWQPPGDTFYCENPWDNLGVGECWSGTNDEIVSSFPRSAFPGVPQSARSAGDWVKVSNTRSGYTMDKELIGSLPYYNWYSHEWSGEELVTNRPDFKEGDTIDVEADGDFNTYFGPWSIREFATVPSQAHFVDDSLTGNRGSLSVNYQNSGDSDKIFFSAILRDQQILCKFENNGGFVVPSSAFSGFAEGWGGASVFTFENSLSAGPDGLPIYSQVFSGQTVPFEVE
jgi:hypothetical protein